MIHSDKETERERERKFSGKKERAMKYVKRIRLIN